MPPVPVGQVNQVIAPVTTWFPFDIHQELIEAAREISGDRLLLTIDCGGADQNSEHEGCDQRQGLIDRQYSFGHVSS